MDPDYDCVASGALPALQEVLPKIATIGKFPLSLFLAPRKRESLVRQDLSRSIEVEGYTDKAPEQKLYPNVRKLWSVY